MIIAAGVFAAFASVAGAGRAPVVYGYPYAAACPLAGLVDAVDRWKMDECNCTSFVAWALEENGQRVDWFVPGAMDAWNWPHVARLAHLPVGARPLVGAVAVWPGLDRPFGHVAYVIAVNRDGSFDVCEYNFPGLDPYRFDERHGVRAHGAVFIYVPPRS